MTIKNIALLFFDDEEIDSAIGRNGMNINLASKITEYKIDAYGVSNYERIKEDHKTNLENVEGANPTTVRKLRDAGIEVVSDF